MLFTLYCSIMYLVSYRFRDVCSMMKFLGINDSPFAYRNMFISTFALNASRTYEPMRVGIVFSLLVISFSYFVSKSIMQEKRTSTIYAIIDVFIKTFLINLLSWLIVCMINVIWFSDSVIKFPLESYGWLPIIQIQFMKLMAEKPEDKVIFGLVKTKYIPFAILSLTFFTYY